MTEGQTQSPLSVSCGQCSGLSRGFFRNKRLPPFTRSYDRSPAVVIVDSFIYFQGGTKCDRSRWGTEISGQEVYHAELGQFYDVAVVSTARCCLDLMKKGKWNKIEFFFHDTRYVPPTHFQELTASRWNDRSSHLFVMLPLILSPVRT